MFKINKIQYNIIGLKQTSIENRLSNHVAQLTPPSKYNLLWTKVHL